MTIFKFYIPLLCSVFLCNHYVQAQEELNYTKIQVERLFNQFDGDSADYYNFLQENLQYPLQARRAGIEGYGIIQFSIDANGIPYNHKIVFGTSEVLSEELIRLSKLANWQPDGKGQVFEMSMPFRLRGSSVVQKEKRYFDEVKWNINKKRYEPAARYLKKILEMKPYKVEYLRLYADVSIISNQIDKACKANFRLQELGETPIEGLTCQVQK